MPSITEKRAQILKKLTFEHPEACRLMTELVATIDKDVRGQELLSDYPRKEVVQFDLVDAYSHLETTLNNLSMADCTSPEFDHGVSVLLKFFTDLAGVGFSLASVPLSNAERQVMIRKLIEVGVEVVLKDPRANSAYDNAFTGVVVSLDQLEHGIIRVEDQEGNQFDVELGEVESVDA